MGCVAARGSAPVAAKRQRKDAMQRQRLYVNDVCTALYFSLHVFVRRWCAPTPPPRTV